MPISSIDIIDRRVGTGGVSGLTEKDVPANFPLARWNDQQARYYKYWRHWTGDFWEQTIPGSKDEEGKAVLRYPLKINYIKTAANKQASAVIGEAPDTSSPLIPIRISPRKTPGQQQFDKAEKQLADEATEFVNAVWDENSGDELQQEGVLISEFLGGIIYGVRWQPDDFDLEYGIRLEYVLPDFFLPVWDTGRPHNLLEAWVIWRVPAREAEMRFGYKSESGASSPILAEHWTRKTINITLDNKPLTFEVEGEVFTYDNLPNPFGEVPFSYIPRKRAGNYYGESIVEVMEGPSIELNARLADIGDIIRRNAQRKLFARNLPNTSLSTVKLGNGQVAYNLGQQAPNTDPPDVFAVDPPKLPEGTKEYPEMIHKQLNNDAATPAVSFGEDQGSQRSGETLNVRFWSLLAEAKSQRVHWKVGLVRIAKIILRMAIVKGVGGMTDAHVKNKKWGCKWAPMLPKDRTQSLNEIVMFMNEIGLHPAEGMEKMDMTEDAWRSYELAQEHKEWLTDQEVKIAKATAEAKQSSMGGSSTSKKPAAKTKK